MAELKISENVISKSDINNQYLELLNSITNSYSEGIIIINQDNEIIFFNNYAKKLLGSLYSNEPGSIIKLPIKLNKKCRLNIKINQFKSRSLEFFTSKFVFNQKQGLIVKIKNIEDINIKQEISKIDDYSDIFNRNDILRYKYNFQQNEFEFYNSGFENLIGKERLNSKNAFNKFQVFILQEDYILLENLLDDLSLKDTIPGEFIYQLQYRIIDSNKQLLWVNDFITIIKEKSGIISIEGIAFIINELKESNIKLSNSETLFNHILAATFDGIFDHNLITDNIKFNDNWYKMLGYSKNEIEPLDIYLHQIVHPHDKDMIFKSLEDHINNNTKQYAVIYRIKAKNGEWLWILSRGKVVEFDETGKPSRVVGTHINITHYKNMEIFYEKSHNILVNLIDNMNEAFSIFTEEAKIIEWNKKAEFITGIKKEIAIGKYLWEIQRLLLRDEEKQKTSYEFYKIFNLENIRKLRKNERINFINTIYKRNGSKNILETQLFPISMPDEEFLGGSLVKDITGFTILSEDYSELDQKMNMIFENLPVVIYKMDLLQNKFDFISSNIESIFGYKPEIFLKEKDADIMDLIHPDDRDSFEKNHFAVKFNPKFISIWQKYWTEYRLMNSSGEYTQVRDTYQIYYDSVGNPLISIGIFNNITLINTRDFELNESLEKYKFIVENQSELIIKLDEKLFCRYISPSFSKLFDMAEKNVLGKKINFEKHPDDKGIAKLAFKKILNNESNISKFHSRMETKYGWLWISWSLKIVKTEGSQFKIVCVGREITKQKRIEETLKLSEKNYRGLFEYAFDSIIVFNPDDEIILDANQSACDLYGFKKEELIGKSLKDFSVDVEFGKTQIEATLQKQENYRFRTKHRNKNGEIFNLDITASLILFDNKQVILSICRKIQGE